MTAGHCLSGPLEQISRWRQAVEQGGFPGCALVNFSLDCHRILCSGVHVSAPAEALLLPGVHGFALAVGQGERFILERLSPIPGVEKIRSSFALKQVRYKTALPLPAAH